jgi:hypothetical protein
MRRRISQLNALIITMVPMMVWGQTPLSENDMQRVMEQAQAMQACFAKIDQTALADLRSKGEAMAAEVKALCTAGRRDDAQHLALTHARTMIDSSAIKALGECGEMAKQMMPAIPGLQDAQGKAQHVCDSGL